MTASLAPSDLSADAQRLHELRRPVAAQLGAVTLALGLLAAVYSIQESYWVPLRTLALCVLAVGGLGALLVQSRHPILAGLFLSFGGAVTLALYIRAVPAPGAPFYGVLIIICASAVAPQLGVLSALLCFIAVWLAPIPASWRDAALILFWLTAAVEWISSRSLYTALRWAQHSERTSTSLLEQLRDQRGLTNRHLEALTEATRRLQRVGYELAEARLRAEEALDAKQRFAANISHELRTPLNLILGFAEMMYLTPDVYGAMTWPPTLRRDVQQIYRSSRQLADLVDDVIDLARLDAVEMPVHRELSDLQAVIGEAIELMRDLNRQGEVKLIVSSAPELPPLLIDRTRIRQVLVNLLRNAIRFTSAGEIRVSTELQGSEVLVRVADTGVGIAPDQLAAIFDEFYQVDMSLRRPNEGAGLGLAISKRFVRLHGGRIWAESEVGKGSTFTFALPLHSALPVADLVRTRPNDPSPHLGQPVALLLEQDAAVASLFAKGLEGWHVVPVARARLEQAVAEWAPRAIIANLPPAPAVVRATHRALEQQVPANVTLAICSVPSRGWLAYESGVACSFSKPVERQALLAALETMGNPQRLFVADDDPAFVELIRRYIASADAGVQVRWAYDGREVLAALRREPADVLLLDVVMPRMDGLAVLSALRRDVRLAQTRVVLITGQAYGQELLQKRGSTLTVWRRNGLTVAEVMRDLAATLGSALAAGGRAAMPDQIPLPEQPATPPG
jgi:signal transduction histidine kinase